MYNLYQHLKNYGLDKNETLKNRVAKLPEQQLTKFLSEYIEITS